MAGSQFPAGLILIVTGSTLRAEQMDRPLAYYLQAQIDALAKGREERMTLVLSDVRYLHETELHALPTLSVGGPGVNQVAQKWLAEEDERQQLPAIFAVENKFFIQMDATPPPRASIWGMDNPQTKIAVVTFAEQYLRRFTRASWLRRRRREDS